MNLLRRELGNKPQKVLDVGTGTAFLAIMCGRLRHQCVGVDISEEMMKVGWEKIQAAGCERFVSLQFGDAENMSFSDGSFDAVINRHLLWTLPEPKKALAEWYRVLKSGGKIIVINGAWSTFGWEQKLLSMIGKVLIALQERENPWSDNYTRILGAVCRPLDLLTYYPINL